MTRSSNRYGCLESWAIWGSSQPPGIPTCLQASHWSIWKRAGPVESRKLPVRTEARDYTQISEVASVDGWWPQDQACARSFPFQTPWLGSIGGMVMSRAAFPSTLAIRKSTLPPQQKEVTQIARDVFFFKWGQIDIKISFRGKKCYISFTPHLVDWDESLPKYNNDEKEQSWWRWC